MKYLCSPFQHKNMILDLINRDVGESGVEGDDLLDDGKATRMSKSTRSNKCRLDA